MTERKPDASSQPCVFDGGCRTPLNCHAQSSCVARQSYARSERGITRELRGGCTCQDVDGMAKCWHTNGVPDCELTPTSPDAPTSSQANGLIAALMHQRQVDEDGTECGVSRQAVDEAINVIVAAERECADLRDRIAVAASFQRAFKKRAEAAESQLAAARADALELQHLRELEELTKPYVNNYSGEVNTLIAGIRKKLAAIRNIGAKP